MSTNLTGARIKSEKNIIIGMYNNDIPIIEIAREYGVVAASLYRHMKKWGIEIKRKAHHKKPKFVNDFRRKFSSELQARMRENTRINNKYIKDYKYAFSSTDQKLIARILSR